ncbi:MAG: hypothetical protein ACOY33_04970 [Pseudomonadota bacterium]
MSLQAFTGRLDAIETALGSGNHQDAFRRLIELLQQVRKGLLQAHTDSATLATACERYSRLHAALVCDPRWNPLQDRSLPAFLAELPDFFSLLALSPSGHLDAALVPQLQTFERQRTAGDFLRLLLLWTPEAGAMAPPFGHFTRARTVIAAQALATVSAMVCCSKRSDQARNAAIGLFSGGQVTVDDLAPFAELPMFGSAWMRCSYATVAGKHDIKPLLNAALRHRLAERPSPAGRSFVPVPLPADPRPLMVVPTEWAFRDGAAMYRCYAPVIRDLRRRFRVFGLGLRNGSDASTVALFDDFRCYEDLASDGQLDVHCVAAAIRALRPAMLFYPSVGMIRTTVCLANLRLAPVQAMSVGHPASSRSPEIDYVLTETGFVGSPDIFSEHLLAVADGAMAFDAPPARGIAAERKDPPDDGRFHVAVPALAHKVSAPLLATLQQARQQARRPMVFHFFSGMSGPNLHELKRHVRDALPEAVVYPWMDYQDYLDRIDRCHVHAASFPFGGTNSLIDSLRQGLPVVALLGREVHERIDAEFMRRIGLADTLVAGSTENYAAILARLADHPAELAALRRRIRDDIDIAGILMTSGRPELFTDALWSVLPKTD